MAVPIDFYDATIVWQAFGAARQATTQIGFGIPLDPGGKTPTEVADDVYDSLTVTLGPCAQPNFSSSWQFQGVSVSLMTGTGPLVGQHLENITGGGTPSTCPPNCAVLITKQTGAGGRRNRGRMFIPPIQPGEAQVNALGQITAGDVEALQEYWSTFLQEMVDKDYLAYLFHQSGDQTPTPITGLLVSGLLATQRRRMRS